METMEEYKIEESIRDTIRILDSAEIRPDLILETNIVQITNRAPIAHLGIERGIKAAITEAGGKFDPKHSLNELYKALKDVNQEAADYLAEAFEDAVKFFGYRVKENGFGHFRSLDDYLSKVGTEKVFRAFRYWAIGEPLHRGIRLVSLQIHRELLEALSCLFRSGRRERVSDRVEQEVKHAMFMRRHISWSSGDTAKELSVRQYKNWLFDEHDTCREALKEAVRKGFNVKDDEFISQTLKEAYQELSQSEDPAVRYFIDTLTYLPKGSQRRHRNARPEVEWLDRGKRNGKVVTPAGTALGFINKYSNGAWGIDPMAAQVTDIAEELADARYYLVNRRTKQVTVTVQGVSKKLRIISGRNFLIPDLPHDKIGGTLKYTLEFWDWEHGLYDGDAIGVELPLATSPGYSDMLEGNVVGVSCQTVSIEGVEHFRRRRTEDC